MTRRPALSPSRAGDFKQCPLLYRFRAVDRIRGTLVHAVLERPWDGTPPPYPGWPAGVRTPSRCSIAPTERA